MTQVYKSGSTVQFKGTSVTGIITAAQIRGEAVQYEIGYWSGDEYKVGWFIEEEFKVSNDIHTQKIGFSESNRRCVLCVQHVAGTCNLLGSIFCGRNLPLGFHCSEFKAKRP